MKNNFFLFRFINKANILIKIFLKSNKNWSLPSKSKLLLYDAFENNFLIEFLKPWRPSMFHTRGEEIYVVVLFLSLFKFKNLREAYLDTFIELVNPSLIITFNDNAKIFYSISERFKNVKTLFIQNGWRAYYGDIFEYMDTVNNADLVSLNVDYKMFFGKINSNHFSSYLLNGKNKSVGSILNNHYIKRLEKEKDLVIFISQWSSSDFKTLKNNISKDDFFKPTDYFILNFLNEYCEKKSMRLKILLRNSPTKNTKDSNLVKIEKEYYQGLVAKNLDFITTDKNFNSYDATDTAEVVVGSESTLLYESIARGNKTAIFSIRDDLLSKSNSNEFFKIKGFTFGWPGKFPSKGFFWTNYASNEDLLFILNNLTQMSHEEWREKLKDFSFDSLMTYDPGNKIITSFLADQLGSS